MFQYMQAMQYFRKLHPEFDFYWQLELDSRYTGHHYHFLEKVAAWSKNQTRNLLWERNTRFYIPAIHGSWDNFSSLVEQNSQQDHADNREIGGMTTEMKPSDGIGRGEEADLVTLFLIFDPTDTKWVMKHIVYNDTDPRRRVSPMMIGRYSASLLDVIHHEQEVNGRGFASEMTAPTFAYQNNMKAVYARHPVFFGRAWPAEFVEKIFNAGPPNKPNGGQDSVFNLGEERYFKDMTYTWQTTFAGVLYKRWLGWTVDGNREYKVPTSCLKFSKALTLTHLRT